MKKKVLLICLIAFAALLSAERLIAPDELPNTQRNLYKKIFQKANFR
jgi:hypothetical protein